MASRREEKISKVFGGVHLSQREKEIQEAFEDTLDQCKEVFKFWWLKENDLSTTEKELLENDYPNNATSLRRLLGSKLQQIVGLVRRDNY